MILLIILVSLLVSIQVSIVFVGKAIKRVETKIDSWEIELSKGEEL